MYYFIKHADLYNYADDNTLCYQHKNVNALPNKWLKSNYMQANPDKFQALVLGINKIKHFTLVCENGNIEIPCDKGVKLFGITFKQDFTFDSYVRYIFANK